MNKIYMVKRNALGQSVVCSEKTKARGKVKSIALAVAATSAMLASVDAVAATATGAGNGAVAIVGDGTGAIAIASQGTATTSKSYSIAVGGNSLATGEGSVAIGARSRAVEGVTATEISSAGILAVGYQAAALDYAAVALGYNANASARGSVSIGENSIAQAVDGISIGHSSKSAYRSVALGYDAKANHSTSIAIGAYTNASHAGAVAIGEESVTKEAITTRTATIGNITLDGFAGTSSSVVSIGRTSDDPPHRNNAFNISRQIINLAAGRVSETSTDAINGSQLYALANTTGNLANSVKTELGGNAALAPNGTITMTNIGGTGQNTIHDAIAFVNAKQGGAAVNVVQGDGITVTNATVNGEKTFTVGLSDATKANITKAQTDAAKGIADAKAADNKAVAAQNTANTANTTAQAANTTANRVAATTYTFSVANGQTAATTTAGTADTWRTTAADSLTLGATTDLSVSTDGAGKVIYGLSDATKANIAKAQTDAAKGIADAAAAQANATKAIADAKAADNKAVAAQNTANTAVTKADAAQATADKAAADIKALDDIAVKYDSTAKDTVTLGGADGTTITNVKDGAITADSKDTVNGGQLFALSEKVNNIKLPEVVQGDGITVTNITVGGTKTFTVALSDETKTSITTAQSTADKAVADAKAADDKAKAAQAAADKAQADATKGIADAAKAQQTADKAAADIKALDDIAVKYDDAAKGTVTLAGADGTTITNVKDGAVTATSKDAVNGSQLYAVKGVADVAKAQSDANKAAITALDTKKADKSALAATDAKVKANADNIAKGFNVATADGTSTNYQLGDTVSILGGKNIDTTTVDGDISVALKDDITVKTIAIDGSTVGMSADGVNAGGKNITNVAPGAISPSSTDAINGSQLHATHNYIDMTAEGIRKHVNEVEDSLEAGIAGTNAAVSLPQVTALGKSMLSVAAGGYKDKSAVAFGYSRLSDNGKMTFKTQVNANSEKEVGYGVGLGFTW